MGDASTGAPEAVVCDHDTMAVAALEQAVEEAGFACGAGLTNPIDALHLVEIDRPALLVTGFDFWGMNGLELATAVRRLDPAPEVVLVLEDLSIKERAMEAGCFAVAARGDLAAMGRILAEVQDFLATGERRKGGERRSGRDRRQHQDWSKVTSERRSGQDRRSGERRTTED